MAIAVTIAGVDKSSYVDWESLSVDQKITSQIDTATFLIKKYGTKNYIPTIGDEVVISHTETALLTEDEEILLDEDGNPIVTEEDSTPLFGGTIITIRDTIRGTMTFLEITCSSHERTLDRYLVVREIQNKNARYIINTIIAEFVNRITRAIDSGESTETWTQEDGTVATTTTAGEFVLGSQAKKFTATASSTATGRAVSTLDLSQFDGGTSFGSSDYVKLWIKVDTIANLTSVRVRFVGDAGATYTNYYETTILATSLIAGWNEVVIAKSAFTSTGSPSWSSILKRQYRVTASASGTVNVVIDDVRTVQESTYFSQTGVQDADTPTLGSAKFNYEQVTDCLKQIADAVGNDWYVDPNRVLYFYQPASIVAPFSLSDTSKNFVYNSLEISSDLSTLKNQIYVRGGEYEGTSTDYDQTADGIALNFRSPYRLKNLSISVASVSKTVGVDNLDDPASYDALYNFQEKTLKFKTATKPTAGQTVRMTGTPMIPVIVKRGDATSIAANGIFEHVIIDKSIVTLQGARDRASAELRNYRNALIEGSFKTDTPGLRAGQTIAIAITARDIDETFVIQSVTFTPKSPTEMMYTASLVSTRTFGIIEYLLTLLRNERKQIAINDNESVDLVQDINEEVTTVDVWSQGSANAQTETITLADVEQDDLNHGTIFVLTPYTPSGFADTKRPFIMDGSPLA